ncbi:MAG TPA: IPT/TIG domain-containing protein [Acidimicrobiales bacterium]|nr:IPT/TIG domain-containing protein [Acidimicrobiales bacterium]
MKRVGVIVAGLLAVGSLVMLGVASGASATSTAPNVGAVVPDHGPTVVPNGGWFVTITGTNLFGASAVTFGGVPAVSFVAKSNSVIKAFAPSGTAGTVDVEVTTSAGTNSPTASDDFTYVSGPVIDSVRPNEGPAGSLPRAQLRYISGANFDPSCTTVDFGSGAATNVTFVSPTSISADAPFEPVGQVAVSVTCTAGTTPADAAATYTYLPPNPQVSAVVFDVGSTAGGETVHIYGKKFLSGSLVDFGANGATNVVRKGSGELQVTAPPGAAGTVDVTVITSRGASSINQQDQYHYSSACPTTNSCNS